MIEQSGPFSDFPPFCASNLASRSASLVACEAIRAWSGDFADGSDEEASA